MKNIRVLIADDHPTILTGLAAGLKRHAITTVGEARTVDEVLPKFQEHRPDVVVLDVRFGEGLTGLDAARALLQADKQARIVFYTQFDSDEVIREAYRIGGLAFLTKQAEPSQVARAIREAAEGREHYPDEIARRLARIGVHGDTSPQAKLDARELHIFTLMAIGRTHLQIAEEVGLSHRQISTIAQTIKDKLGVQHQADITRLAVKHLLIAP